MAKGNYYAGMATAPQVKPADFSKPFVNMAERLVQSEIDKRKEEAKRKKENEQFRLSRKEKVMDNLNTTLADGTGIEQIDVAATKFQKHLIQDYEIANAEFEADGNKDKLLGRGANAMNSARQVSQITNRFQDFDNKASALEARGEGSLWNDFIYTYMNDANRSLGFETRADGVVSLVAIGEDGISRKLPATSIPSFFLARQKTDLSAEIDDIVKNTKGLEIPGKNSVTTRYLDYSSNPEGELPVAVQELIAKRVENMETPDLYDAAVRAGHVGDENWQIPLITEASNEGEVVSEIKEAMRKTVANDMLFEARMKLMAKEGTEARPISTSGSTPKQNFLFDQETGKYSFRSGTRTSFRLTSGFKGKDSVNGTPTGESKEIPPGASITDVKLTPFGLEVWGVQIRDKETGQILSFDDIDAQKLTDAELTSMGGNRINFHKIIDPASAAAVGELQRIVGFSRDEYADNLKLNPNTIPTDDGDSFITPPEVDTPDRY